MSRNFRAATRRVDERGGPVKTVRGVADHAAASSNALADGAIQAAGGSHADYVHEILPTDAEDGGFFTKDQGDDVVAAIESLDNAIPAAAALADGAAVPTTIKVGSIPELYNGSTVDFQRGNTSFSILALVARAIAQEYTDGPYTNHNARGCHIVIKVTAVTATPSVVFKIQGYDPVNNDWYDILESAAVTSISRVVLKVYPGIAVAANLSASDILPRTFRISATHADTDSITYSIACHLVV